MKPQPHSPGPWTADQTDEHAYVIHDAHNNVVCEINGPYTPSLDRYKADAALIAASPQLLEACRVAVDFLDDGPEIENYSGEELLALLRNAIERTVAYEDDGE